jgi:hypothetical protein
MFNGRLIAVGGNDIPKEYIQFDDYEATPNQRQDVDSQRDLNQDLHRNVSPHYKSVVKFATRPLLEEQLRDLMDNYINPAYINERERKLELEFYDPETGDYYSGEYYMVQPKFKIRVIEDRGNGPTIKYDPIDFEFIQY